MDFTTRMQVRSDGTGVGLLPAMLWQGPQAMFASKVEVADLPELQVAL